MNEPSATHPTVGRADLHLHTMASDGTAGVAAILRHAENETDLAIIAITDHDRLDAAQVARGMARDEGLRVEVIVGEEVTTRGGHLLGLFLESPIAPFRSLRDTVAEIHDAGGLAIPAHPLAPSPSCAQGFMLRRLLGESDARFHLDGLETFNPTPYGWAAGLSPDHFARRHNLALLGSSDAHALSAIGAGWTEFPGRNAVDLRRAIEDRTTTAHGQTHSLSLQLLVFGAQLRKNGRDLVAGTVGRWYGEGKGRDLGLPKAKFD